MHLNELAARVKEGVEAAGLVGMRFNTIGVSDGISQGTDGMSYLLPSRDIIADSIETVMSAPRYHRLVAIPGDKNMPGSVMAMARLNRPGLVIYGGMIRPASCKAGPWISSRPWRPTASISAAASTTPPAARSFAIPAPVRGHAAGCTRPTPCPA